MELPSKVLEQIAFHTRPKVEEHMLIVMDKSTHEEHLAQPLQTKNKQFKKGVNFLTGYNGLFDITNSNIRFSVAKSITDEDGFIQIATPPSAYEIETLNNEINNISIDTGHFTEKDYPFTIKPNFSTLGSIIEIIPQEPISSYVFEDNIKKLLGFRETMLFQENKLSSNPVDIFSFDNIFIHKDIAQGMIFKGKR